MDKKQAVAAGFGVTESIGGIKKRKYWTPDGREMRQVPHIIGSVDKKSGEPGERDGNLDQWLDRPPENPVPYCPHCDKWHDTEDLVEACQKKKQASQARFDRLAKRMKKEEQSGTDERLDKLEDMMGQILERLGGQVLQPSGNEPETGSEESGSLEAGV